MHKALLKPRTLATLAFSASVAVLPTACAAQNPPSSSQSTQLAQNSGNGPNLFSLYQQIQQLQQQVRELNGQVDTLQYKLKQSEQGQRDLYKNLDQRLSQLENSDAGSNANAGSSPGEPTGTSPASSGNGDVDPAIQSAYMDGFNQLQNGKYDAAIASFKQFVAQHPETSLTDNAWYWLGEANYVQQNMGDSLEAFETVVNRFKNSPKMPAALYKIGLIQIAQNQTDNGESTLQRVVDQYPDSDSADLAQQKLQSLGGSN